MELSINFAHSLGPYDNLLNKWCTNYFCHCECSVKVDCGVFRVLIDSVIDSAYDPTMLASIQNRIRNCTGDLDIAFFILFNSKFTIRFLNNLSEEPFLRIPEAPIYECVTLNFELEKGYDILRWNLVQLGKDYDIPRAVCLLLPVTLKQVGTPERFFCSQLMMHMIKDNDIFDTSECNVDHMNPDNVYQFLNEKKPDENPEDPEVKAEE